MRLSYLKAYGRNGLQGQWWPGDADSRRKPRRTFTEGSGWELSIEAAIAHLLPALGATHALLSVGGMHVPERSPLVEAEFRAWQRAFENTSVHPTWKTYTRPRDEKDTPVASRFFNVFDAGALVRAHQANKSGVYIDDRGHIDAEANNLINVEMIRRLFVEQPSTPGASPGQDLRQSHTPTYLGPNTKSSAAPPPADEPNVLSVRSAVQRYGNALTRTVITTMSNQASRQELLLWAAMLHEHRERHFFVLATDDPVLSTCARFSIPCARERSTAADMSTESGEIRYSQQQGSQHYVSGRVKLALVVEILRLEFAVLYTDLDVLWVQHPLHGPHGLLTSAVPGVDSSTETEQWRAKQCGLQIMVNAVPSSKWGPRPGVECHNSRGAVRYVPTRGFTCVVELNGGFFLAESGALAPMEAALADATLHAKWDQEVTHVPR